MIQNRGYALIETLMASIILASGLITVALLFSVTAGVSFRNRQFTTATLLAYDKLEQLHSTGFTPGGGLDAANPVPGYADYVDIGEDGILVVQTIPSPSSYLRLWEIQDPAPQTITVAVFAGMGSFQRLELARATGSFAAH